MTLPQIEDCTCPCHDPSSTKAYASHSGACCTGGMTLAWGAWDIDGDYEMVTRPKTFSDDEED